MQEFLKPGERFSNVFSQVTRIVPGNSGEALVTVNADPNAKSFKIRSADMDDTNTPGPFRPVVVCTSSRNMAVGGLVPGRFYLFQVSGVGGLNGHSNWSDAMVQRAA